MRLSSTLATNLSVGFLLCFPGSLLYATDCSVADPRRSVSTGSLFNLSSSQFSEMELNQSIGYWSGCSVYGIGMPTLQVGGSDGVPVTVERVTGTGSSCGENQVFPNSSGQVLRATITVYTQQADGTSCEPLTDVIAHELGHIFGLDNAPAGLECRGHIMGERTAGGTRSVFGDDCEVANQMWVTPAESEPPPDPYCEVYCWTSCIYNTCPPRFPGSGCPILVDLENDGIHLTGLDDPVWFDIDADGAPDLMSWTDRSEGLLALDRNGNGIIDNGGELFGNFTRLADGSRALNGYLALAELDTWIFGGNGDGFIDASDEAFGSLRMWTDRSHDGTSQPSELHTLEEAGIRRIELEYRRSNRTDRYGNTFRFLGRAWRDGRNGAVRPVLAWDVFFVVAP